MTTEAVRAWLEDRYGEDEQAAYRIRDQRWCVEGEGFVESDVTTFAHEDRILREVAAKRQRLERHSPLISVDPLTGDESAVCSWCRAWTGDWPCEDLADDAQAYADRDDFPAELALR